MATLCLIVLSLQYTSKSLSLSFNESHGSCFLSLLYESEWQMPFNLKELKHREYKDFVQSLPQIYFWTWKQNWAGGNISTHL